MNKMRFKQICWVLFFLLYAVTSKAQLNGTYTIGGTSSDYSTINAAVSDLVSQGVSGAVVFNIRDGIYNEQLLINTIPGASVVNAITFQSENGDSSLVTIVCTSDTTNTNYTVKLDSASFITLRHVTLQATGLDSCDVLEISNGSCHNHILNCRLISILKRGFLINSNQHIDSANVIMNNFFLNGAYGIEFDLQGGTPYYEEGNSIRNNIFINQSMIAIKFIYQKNLTIKNNYIYSSVIHTNLEGNGWLGIAVGGSYENVEVSYNKVTLKADSCGGWICGISTGGYLGTSNAGVKIINNSVNITNYNNIPSYFAIVVGINLQSGIYAHIYNNSVRTEGNNANMFTFSSNSSYYCKIFNNIFANFSTNDSSATVKIISDPGSHVMNYNCFYSTSNTLALSSYNNYMESLSDWQQFSGTDSNSISCNPLFTDSLWHVSSSSPVCGRGMYLPEVTDDIEGAIRNNPPTIGAYELDNCNTGFKEVATSALSFRIYPNPASNTLNIESSTTFSQLIISDVLGNVVIKQHVYNTAVGVDVSGLSKGLYFLRIENENGFVVKKFLKELRCGG